MSEQHCPTCTCNGHRPNGRFISPTDIGKHVQSKYPKVFSWLDVDGVSWKRSRRTLRVIESKHVGEDLRDCQREVLPLIAEAIDLWKQAKPGRRGSVWVLRGDPPYEKAEAQRYAADPTGWRLLPKQQMSTDEIDRLLTGESLAP